MLKFIENLNQNEEILKYIIYTFIKKDNVTVSEVSRISGISRRCANDHKEKLITLLNVEIDFKIKRNLFIPIKIRESVINELINLINHLKERFRFPVIYLLKRSLSKNQFNHSLFKKLNDIANTYM